jgi:signal transduction histidine kinase
MMRTDKVLLKVILNNLIDNALKYSPPESKVDLSATPVGAGIAIVVENDVGHAGRPDVSKVFSKYYRSPMARQTGSGLGLYVIKGLSAQLGGQLNYAPASPKVRFELWLPS